MRSLIPTASAPRVILAPHRANAAISQRRGFALASADARISARPLSDEGRIACQRQPGQVRISNSHIEQRYAAVRDTTQMRLSTGARPYSTAPNQEQVMQSFGTPFAQFIFTISRIARMFALTAVGVAAIGLVSFEAAHQYVEHVAMAPTSSRPHRGEDEWGWTDQAIEESWSGTLKSGTDSRLGIKGRHAVRSAWMCVNWGGGISPGVLFGGGAAGNSGLGRTALTSMAGAKTLHIDDGMILAMQYLQVAIRAAAAKGIKLPDIDGIRAGVVSTDKVRVQMASIDPLALALEYRMAAVRERQGSPRALEAAISSYEKLYDIAAFRAHDDTARQPAAASNSTAKMVRLATKIGDLHNALGQRDQGIQWLQRAVSLAGASGPVGLADETIVVEDKSRDSSLVASASSLTGEKPRSRWFSWFSSSAVDAAAGTSDGASDIPASAAAKLAPAPSELQIPPTQATPAMTRALISSLLSLSATYAQRPTSEQQEAQGTGTTASAATWRSSLQQALEVQTGALRLASLELERHHTASKTLSLSASSSSSSSTPTLAVSAESLHNLWMKHHVSILYLHLAETLYALDAHARASGSPSPSQSPSQSPSPSPSDSIKSLFGRSSSHSPDHLSAKKIREALANSASLAQYVRTQLSRSPSPSLDGSRAKPPPRDAEQDPKLSTDWATGSLTLFATRLLRDSRRVVHVAKRLSDAVGADHAA
ncbi:hypothetical protein BCV70DRAFT_200278 [Testicularia cyperi]|uniref:Uncharacterized protein n=1 Tax=Testicularia cyperi TaxID=1882483 RepID=A0A317XRZ1_9BASI|nr:hypothetical protein BCV70DRAFT_200278 [Testicularia cyperi]